MKELIKTNELAVISHVKLLLTNENIEHFELDVHMSVLEGSIGILPRRILVSEHYLHRAQRILSDNGIDYL